MPFTLILHIYIVCPHLSTVKYFVHICRSIVYMKQTFAQRLKELREENGLSQRQLEVKLAGKITKSAICNWELGKRTPNLEAVIILADFFGVTLDYIAGREN